MLLTLKVKSYQGAPPSEPTSFCFNKQGGTIGRSAGNDLVLPDPENFISRRHAQISYEGGRYILADLSLSGTAIGDGQALKQSSTELRDGMLIQIGDYELSVTIEEANKSEPVFGASKQGDGDLTDMISQFGNSFSDPVLTQNSFSAFDDTPALGLSADSADSFGSPFGHEKRPLHASSSPLEYKSPILDSMNPPHARFEPGSVDMPEDFDIEDLFASPPPDESRPPVIPSTPSRHKTDRDGPLGKPLDFDLARDSTIESGADRLIQPHSALQSQPKQPLGEAKVPPVKPIVAENSNPRSNRISAPVEGSGQRNPLFSILLEAMGLDETDFRQGTGTEDTVRLIGEMVRELIKGMMILLRSRAELKNQFRVSVTTIRPAENNPLKFSITVPDALNALLKPGQKGYLKPLDAIHNSFNDVNNHQMAMTAGIQASLTDLLKKFDPERFEKQFGSGLFGKKDAKCWEAYSQSYGHLVNEVIEDLFGKAFIAAYEKQIQALEAAKEKNRPGFPR